MAWQMKPAWASCGVRLFPDGEAFICRYECTFCPPYTDDSNAICPTCSSALLVRPQCERKG